MQLQEHGLFEERWEGVSNRGVECGSLYLSDYILYVSILIIMTKKKPVIQEVPLTICMCLLIV